MTKKARLIILLVCVACFLAATPVLIAYSMGYRVDFETMKITPTGGIYVRTSPAADEITIDAKISQKPGIFNNAVFVQSLLPKNHSVLVVKNGYYGYTKNLLVQGKEVTKLENVLLFKKDIIFQTVTDKTKSPFSAQYQMKKFAIKNNNLYYSTAQENAGLTATQKNTPVIKNIVAFEISNNNIVWLGTDGLLYQSDINGKNPVKLTLEPLTINKKGSYKIILNGQNIFINDNGSLLALQNQKNTLDAFVKSVKDAKISPDGKNIVYYTGKEIYISLLSDPAKIKTILYKSPENITDIFWMNNDYIIFSAGDKITISEIDYRGNINAVAIPSKLDFGENKVIEIKSPKISFNQQEGNLYILTQNILLSSEKIIP